MTTNRPKQQLEYRHEYNANWLMWAQQFQGNFKVQQWLNNGTGWLATQTDADRPHKMDAKGHLTAAKDKHKRPFSLFPTLRLRLEQILMQSLQFILYFCFFFYRVSNRSSEVLY